MDQDWKAQYESLGALWIHDGNPLRPHAELTSGKHSSGFFNSELVMEDPLVLEEAAQALVHKMVGCGLNLDHMDRVVGPAMGAITLAHDLARVIAKRRGVACLRAYAEKHESGSVRFKRTIFHRGELVLLCEDVITTGGSARKVNLAVLEQGARVLPFVAALVNRSDVTEIDGCTIVALVEHPMPQWEADVCPLCTQGSEALKPKVAGNWDKLNASY